MLFHEVLHELGQDRGRQRWERGDSDSALPQRSVVRNVGQGFVERGERFLCDFIKLPTDRREFDIAGIAVQQRDLEIILELTDECA
jgi:hypothetical protein